MPDGSFLFSVWREFWGLVLNIACWAAVIWAGFAHPFIWIMLAVAWGVWIISKGPQEEEKELQK